MGGVRPESARLILMGILTWPLYSLDTLLPLLPLKTMIMWSLFSNLDWELMKTRLPSFLAENCLSIGVLTEK